jgi:recombination protein RecA
MAPPFREVEFDILYGQGISRSGDLIDLASDMNLVEKSGAWYSFQGERIGQGRENAKTYLEAHPDLMEKLEQMILVKHGIKRGPALGLSSPDNRKEGQANGAAASETDEKPKRAAQAAKPAN